MHKLQLPCRLPGWSQAVVCCQLLPALHLLLHLALHNVADRHDTCLQDVQGIVDTCATKLLLETDGG